MRVKFCGMTNLDDAAEAVRLGAWAIGLIHFDGSPRYVRAGGRGRDRRRLPAQVRGGRGLRQPDPGGGAAGGRGRRADDGAAERRRGRVLLRRGGAADRGQGDQGDPRRQRRRRPRRRGLPHRLPPLRPPRQGPVGRHRAELRLGAAARAPLRGAGDPRRRPAPRQRRRGDRGRPPLRGRRRQRRRGRARPQGPRGDVAFFEAASSVDVAAG